MPETDYNTLGLFNCEPKEIIELLRFGTDSDVVLYPFLQALTLENFVAVDALEWHDMCLMDEASYGIASSEVVLRTSERSRSLYLIEVNIETPGKEETMRFAYDSLEEAEQGFVAQQEQLRKRFPDCDLAFDSELDEIFDDVFGK